MDIFSIFLDTKVCCMFIIRIQGDSNEYTQYTIFNIKKKITCYLKFATVGFFSKKPQELVRNSRGKRARATEIPLK